MADRPEDSALFATSQMAEILIEQNLIDEARALIDRLIEKDPNDPRAISLASRIDEISSGCDAEQIATAPTGKGFVSLDCQKNTLCVSWEMTEHELAIARRKVGYSGRTVLRFFSAVSKPRGVRTALRDIEIKHLTAQLSLPGLPRPAVYLAAVGFACNTGEFVPVARSTPLAVDS